MPSRSSRKKMEQDGVDAIFTSSGRMKKDAQAAATLVSFGLGAGLWTWSFRAFAAAGGIGSTLSPLVPFIVGSAFLTGGVGAFAYFLGTRSPARKNNRSRRTKTTVERSTTATQGSLSDPVLEIVRNVRQARQNRLATGLPKLFLMIILQSVLIVSLYLWLVQEYQSNAKMQTWFGPNMIFASAFFSYDAVAVSAIVMLLLAFESLPGRRLNRLNY